MSDSLVWFVGNRSPSITETITSEGVPVDLTAASVKFKMREVGSETLKVNTAAVIETPPTSGKVRYDWLSTDVDAPGRYLVWWEVTAGAKTEDMNEALVEFRDHGPAPAYVELEELKSTAELTGTNFADPDIQNALEAASRGIEEVVGRRFYLDTDATQVRYYSRADVEEDGFHNRAYSELWDGPYGRWHRAHETLRIDDLVSLTSFQTDADGDGTFEQTWAANTDFVLEPLNASADGKPYDQIRVLRNGHFRLPGYVDAIKITGKFGWPNVPAGVKQATTIVATRLLQRARQAPFGVVSVGLDGAAVRAASLARDPEVNFLLEPFTRRRLFV